MAIDHISSTPTTSRSGLNRRHRREYEYLVDSKEVAHLPVRIGINHLQLRNMLQYPPTSSLERDEESMFLGGGSHNATLYSTQSRSIMQHRITKSRSGESMATPTLTSQVITKLSFEPVCLAIVLTPPLSIPSEVASNSPSLKKHPRRRVRCYLVAAGGHAADLHLSLHTPTFDLVLWSTNVTLLRNASINNSVLIIPGLESCVRDHERHWGDEYEGEFWTDDDDDMTTRDYSESQTMRILVSNNDDTVKIFIVDLTIALAMSSSNHPNPNTANPTTTVTPPSSIPPRSMYSRILGGPPSNRSRRTEDFEERIASLPSSSSSSPATAPSLALTKQSEIRLDSAVNFATTNPDHNTLLSVTDSHQIYLHALPPFSPSAGARTDPQLLTKLTLPYSQPTSHSLQPQLTTLRPQHQFLTETGLHASFAAHFNSDGHLFAVGSQAGVVSIWDVRSSKPIFTYLTPLRNNSFSDSNTSSSDHAQIVYSHLISPPPMLNFERRISGANVLRGTASSISSSGRAKQAPPYGVRCLKFGRGASKNLLAFTEHTRFVHILDTRTFETHQILEIPTPLPPLPPIDPSETPTVPNSPQSPSPQRRLPRQGQRLRRQSQGSNMIILGGGPSVYANTSNATNRLPVVPPPPPPPADLGLLHPTEMRIVSMDGETMTAREVVMREQERRAHESNVARSMWRQQTQQRDPTEREEYDRAVLRTFDNQPPPPPAGSSNTHRDSSLDAAMTLMVNALSREHRTPDETEEAVMRALRVPLRTAGRWLGGIPGERSDLAPPPPPPPPLPPLVDPSSSSGEVSPAPPALIDLSTESDSDSDMLPPTTTIIASSTPIPVAPPISGSTSAVPTQNAAVPPAALTTTDMPAGETTPQEEIDIAGLAWSPDGESLFVATTESVIEWRITDYGRARMGESVWQWR